jgi:hypothetical protein
MPSPVHMSGQSHAWTCRSHRPRRHTGRMSDQVTESRSHPSARVTLLALVLVVAVLLSLASLILALTPVRGSTEGETFHCGTPFAYADSGNYAGTLGFIACDDRRHERAVLAILGLALGAGVAASAGIWSYRSRRADARIST